MELYYTIAEWLATLVENAVILCAVLTFSGKKYSGKKNFLLILFFCVFTSIIVSALNQISLFSFLTPIVSMCFVIFVSSRILSNGPLAVRSTYCILAYVVIQSFDYIILIFVGMYYGVLEHVFTAFITPGVPRTTYIMTDKVFDIVLYVLLKKAYKKEIVLENRHQWILLSLSITVYIFIQYLFNVVISSEKAKLQSSIIFSWFFALCFIFAILALFSSLTRTEHMFQRQKMLQSENALMAENYARLNNQHQEYAKELHDFKHHLTAIKGLCIEGNSNQIASYVTALLNTSDYNAPLCHSGNAITDAIINCKCAEAAALNIAFRFTANLHDPVSIDPIDICGVLANQIDNAFDACAKIAAVENRSVNVEIKQVKDIAFFKVDNTVESDPFENNKNLKSTKQGVEIHHGFGLENIRSIAEKYNGYMRTEYLDGRFFSSVSLCYKPLDTENYTI